jgi:lipid-A-disaccharide synthase
VALKVLISAGEASGDIYAASLGAELRRRHEGLELFGCAGPRMREAGVRAVVDAASLAVVGLVEVVGHIPRIRREFSRLLDAAREERPALAILTDSPDFHLRLARRLKRMGIPVVYLVAPQVWAWRKGRLAGMRRSIDQLLCIFPFEQAFFRQHGIPATYIGHPLSRLVRPSLGKEEFFRKHGLAEDRPLVALLPGSRRDEAARHMPALAGAAAGIARRLPVNLVLALPAGRFVISDLPGLNDFKERNPGGAIKVVEGETWDVLAHATLALAASGTVTVEAALLGTPMITFYKVTALSWYAGKFLVDVPFYSMVNLIAGHAAVPELMQNEMRAERLASEALKLLNSSAARDEMRRELATVSRALAGLEDPTERAADIVDKILATKR